MCRLTSSPPSSVILQLDLDAVTLIAANDEGLNPLGLHAGDDRAGVDSLPSRGPPCFSLLLPGPSPNSRSIRTCSRDRNRATD